MIPPFLESGCSCFLELMLTPFQKGGCALHFEEEDSNGCSRSEYIQVVTISPHNQPPTHLFKRNMYVPVKRMDTRSIASEVIMRSESAIS